MPEFTVEKYINVKNSVYHFIFKKNIDWLIISGALYLLCSNMPSKNLYFLSGKLLLMFCMVELIRRYFFTWNQLRNYYYTRDRLRQYSMEEIAERENVPVRNRADVRANVEQQSLELNKLLMKSYDKGYDNLNDYYKRERADFAAFQSLWKQFPEGQQTSFEGYISFIVEVLNIKYIPGDEKKNYKRISAILVIGLLFLGIYYLEIWLLSDIL